jgi:hypothetical protein
MKHQLRVSTCTTTDHWILETKRLWTIKMKDFDHLGKLIDSTLRRLEEVILGESASNKY